MMQTIYAMLAVGLLIGGASAQQFQEEAASATKRDADAWKMSPTISCTGYEIDHLKEATNTNLPEAEQRKHLNAAEAYSRLQEVGYQC